MSKKITNCSGFSLIEIIVVVGVIAMVLPLLFSIVFVILQAQAKVYRLSEVKKQGDFSSSIMKTVIRNSAVSIYDPQTDEEHCKDVASQHESTDGSDFGFKDTADASFNFILSNDRIASTSSRLSENLTTDKVKISDFSIKCSKTAAFSPPLVTFSYTVCYKNNSDPTQACDSSRPEETASLRYQATVKLKNH